ncbi:MAG: N-acetyl-gamma-glutamyl-phosphate reductase, partial [Candidatus Omnitrophica bacterium]|nr:N-acetyl-gamma-glutamyl-phosphate reductase [Candidatus Omnitrophota bacterium]
MINVGIVGASGYSGRELLDILLSHPQIRVTYVGAHNTTGSLTELWPELSGRTRLYCEKYSLQSAVEKCDLVFLAVPHTSSMAITPELLRAGIKVIDLSGDYRLKSKKIYKEWYGASHTDASNIRKAVYGLPELYRKKKKKAKLLTNPG